MNCSDTAQHLEDIAPQATGGKSRRFGCATYRAGAWTLFPCLGAVAVVVVACASVSTVPIPNPNRPAFPQRPPPPQPVEKDDGCQSKDFPNNTVVVCNMKNPGGFKVINKYVTPISLLSSVRIQVQGNDGSWRTTSERADLSRSRNESERMGCLVLGGGEELKPPSWFGLDCTNPFRPYCSGPQSPPGRVRLVVLSCDRTQHFESPPLEPLEYTIENAQYQ
jgi:hypothetical protein